MTRDEEIEFYAQDAAMEPVGPPVRRTAPVLTEHVPIRFSPQTIGVIRRLAGHDGMTVSSWIRQAVARAIRESEVWVVPSYPPPTTTENSTPITYRWKGSTDALL